MQAWFRERELVAQLPLIFRAYAGYCRRMSDPNTGLVRGGSFVFRRIRDATRQLGLHDEAVIEWNLRRMHVDLTDQRVLWVFNEIRANSPEHRFLEAFLRAGDSFIDIGANHGSYALVAAQCVGKTGWVVAVEPQPRLARLLARSLKDAGTGFDVYTFACGGTDGSTEFFVPAEGSGSAGVHKGFSAREPHTRIVIPLRRLDTAIEWKQLPGRIVMKIDVEGNELAVLRGAEQLIRARRPSLLLEANPTTMKAAGYGPSHLLEVLRELGYTEIMDARDFPHKRELDFSEQRNLLALPG